MGDNLREVQLAESILGPLLRGEKPSLEQLGSLSRSSRRLLQLWEQLVASAGVLCRRFESADGSTSILQIVVPTALREVVLSQLHEGAIGGHFGVDKTLARLRERFYWPGQFNDVRDWCGNCSTCAARKAPTPTARAPLTSIIT